VRHNRLPAADFAVWAADFAVFKKNFITFSEFWEFLKIVFSTSSDLIMRASLL